jgi:ribose transport system substrate-binding protein
MHSRLTLGNTDYDDASVNIQEKLLELDQRWRNASDSDIFIQDHLNNPIAVELRNFEKSFPNHVESFVTDQYGGLMGTTNITSDYYQADEEWWQVAYNNGRGATYISTPEFDESSGTFGLLIALPFYDSAGNVSGILRSTYSLNQLNNFLDLGDQLGQTGRVELHLPDGMAFEPKSNRLEPSNFDLNMLEQPQALELGYIEALYQETPSLISQASINDATHDPAVNNLDWKVIVRQSRNEALAPVVNQRRSLVAPALVVAGLAVIAAIGISQFLVKPISRLTDAAQQIAKGNLKVRATADADDEIGTLAVAFNVMTDQLQVVIDTLEQRITDRTRRLETLVEVSQQLSSFLDLSDLMRQVVILTKETFNYYHVHIYLLDETQETLLMTEGYGEAGAEMKRQVHTISLDAGKSLVAQAAREGRTVTVANVRENPDWLPNPLLPDTRAEMAVPVVLKDEVVGVLDVQSEVVGGLTNEDEATLQALANQIATGMRNARLFSETQDALYQAQKMRRLYTEQVWDKFAAEKDSTFFEKRRHPETPALRQTETPEALIAIQQRKTVQLKAGAVSSPPEGNHHDENALATPLQLGGKVIGVLGIHDEDLGRQWTDDEIALIESVSEQMSLAIENARLFNDTRQQAIREKIIADITQEIWASNQLEQVMQNTIEQLGTTLNASKAVIRLGTSTQLINSYYQLIESLGPMPQLSKPYKIGAVLKFFGNERWQLMADGMHAQAQKYGIQLDVRAAASEDDQAGQLALMEAMLEQDNYDAFIVSPQSSENLMPAIEKAKEAGILIVNGEDAVIPDAEHWVGPNHYEIGAASARYFLQQLPQGGKVAVIEGQAGSSSAQLRTKGFIETLTETNLRLVARKHGDWDWQKAFDAASQIIKEYPAINGFYANNDVMALAVVEAVKEAGKLGQVMIIGADGIEQAYAAIKAGEMTATNTIFPALGGEVTLELTLRRLIGQEIPRIVWSPQGLVTLDNVDNPQPVLAAQEDAAKRRGTAQSGILKVWGDIIRKVATTGYVFTQYGLTPVRNAWLPTMDQAVQMQRLVHGNNQATSISTLAIPLILRGEVIGAIGIDRAGRGQWSDDELAIVQTITEQSALALDAARLTLETERSAWRDRVVSESTAQIWSSDKIEEVMRTAVAQLGDKLRASEVVIRLALEEEPEQ